MCAAAPAPRCTITSSPEPINRLTLSGTSATRCSPGAVSAGMPIRIRASSPCGRVAARVQHGASGDKRLPAHGARVRYPSCAGVRDTHSEVSMPMRLQEVHPAMVHFPIAFLPIAIGADLLGRLTGSRTLMTLGKAAIGIAAAGAATAATTGLIAQQEVNADGEALDMLITHRNLNLAATAVATAMATWRGARDEPSAPYLALGLASTALVYYTAYL